MTEDEREIELLRGTIKLILGRKTGVPFYDVPDSEVDSYRSEYIDVLRISSERRTNGSL